MAVAVIPGKTADLMRKYGRSAAGYPKTSLPTGRMLLSATAPAGLSSRTKAHGMYKYGKEDGLRLEPGEMQNFISSRAGRSRTYLKPRIRRSPRRPVPGPHRQRPVRESNPSRLLDRQVATPAA